MKNLNYDNFELKYFTDKKLGYDLINEDSNLYEIKLASELEESDAPRIVKAFFSSNPFEKNVKFLSGILFANTIITKRTSKQTGLPEYIITVGDSEKSVYTDFFEAVKTMDLSEWLSKGSYSVKLSSENPSAYLLLTAKQAVNNSITVYLKELKIKTMSYAEFESTYQGNEYDLMSLKVIKAELTGDSVFMSGLSEVNDIPVQVNDSGEIICRYEISKLKVAYYAGEYVEPGVINESYTGTYKSWEEFKLFFNTNDFVSLNESLYHPTCENQTVLNNYKNQLILTITE